MDSRLIVLLVIPLLGAGCIERTLSVNSNPQGSLVTMNGQEIGRTPFKRDFTWYGKYDVEIRKDGYQTLKTATAVREPWYQWVPIDLVVELLPVMFHDDHTIAYTLKPQPADIDAQALLQRSEQMRGMLVGSRLKAAVAQKQASSQVPPPHEPQ
jgi:hypothetical protein